VLTPQGIAILNYDDPYVRDMATQTEARVLFYGFGGEAEVAASDIAVIHSQGTASLSLPRDSISASQLHLPGSHGVMMALARCRRRLRGGNANLMTSVPPSKAFHQPAVAAKSKRDQMQYLIDDTYNAIVNRLSPLSRLCKPLKSLQAANRWLYGRYFSS